MTAPTPQKEAVKHALAMASDAASDDGRDPRDDRNTSLQLLDVRTVARLLGCHKATVWKRVSAGQLPAPVRVAGLTRWRLRDIEAAINAASPSRSALGPRPLAELLAETADATACPEIVADRVAAYAALPAETVRALGADGFPPLPLSEVA